MNTTLILSADRCGQLPVREASIEPGDSWARVMLRDLDICTGELYTLDKMMTRGGCPGRAWFHVVTPRKRLIAREIKLTAFNQDDIGSVRFMFDVVAPESGESS